MKDLLITYIICGALAFGFTVYGLNLFFECRRIQDLTNMGHNFQLVYSRLEDYKKKHGSYPLQQDMKSLLKTLHLSNGDLFKVSIDIGTAVYHAPKQNSDAPILMICIKPHLLRRKQQQIVAQKHNGYVQCFLTDIE